MHKTVLIFDWDDTLMDVGKYLCNSQYDACQAILQQQSKYPFTRYWPKPSMTTLETYVGHRFAETIIPGIFTEFDINNPQHKLWQQNLMKLFLQNYRAQPKQLFPEITAMLTNLKQQNYPLTIATNKSRHLLMSDFEAAGLNHTMFDLLVCGDDATLEGKFKPHPNMINIIQNNFSNAPSFVMIGDRESDMVAAKHSEKQQLTKTIAIAAADNDFNADYTTNTAANITSTVIKDLVQSGESHR